jgi:hypothetical protein
MKKKSYIVFVEDILSSMEKIGSSVLSVGMILA